MMQIAYWPLAKFIPYSRNPRKNDHVVNKMVASIREFGFKIPILVRTSGDIIDGHLRLKAAQKLELLEVPVILCDDWSETQVRAFRLMVNRSATWADWDTELVALEISELKAMDFDLHLTGFKPIEIDGFLFANEQNGRVEDEIPALPVEAVTTLGDRWRCGDHLIRVAMLLRKMQFNSCLEPGSRS